MQIEYYTARQASAMFQELLALAGPAHCCSSHMQKQKEVLVHCVSHSDFLFTLPLADKRRVESFVAATRHYLTSCPLSFQIYFFLY